MQKKAMIIITALLLLLIVPSAIAIPKTKEPKPKLKPKPKTPKTPVGPKKETITFTELATLGAGDIYVGNQQIDDAGILYVQDAISTGTVDSGDSPISGFEILTSLSGTLDLSTYLGSYNGQFVITGKSGSFEGPINGEIEVATISGKFVGHGIGDFKDQKIKGTFEGSVNNFKIEITIQATITSNPN